MSRKKAKNKIQQGLHSFLVARVEQYDIDLDYSVNHSVYQPEYAIVLDDDEPLFKNTSHLTLTGRIVEPKDRFNHKLTLYLMGGESPSSRNNSTLKDAQSRGKYGEPQYRTYRGREIPIYDPPNGLARLRKVTGEAEWISFMWVPSLLISDMLVLLGQKEGLFVTLNEWKAERKRWVRAIGLKSTDPLEE